MTRLSRYGIVDPYTLEELSRRYKMADARGRIRVLRLFCGQQNGRGNEPPDLPFEIALMAVEDPNVEVRQWIARNARFLHYGDPAAPPHSKRRTGDS